MAKLTKVEVVQDNGPCDPREDMDLMCKIEEVSSSSWYSHDMVKTEKLIALVMESKGYKVVERFAEATDTDPPDFDEDGVLDQWLEQLKGTELLTQELHLGRCEYLAYTTPWMCDRLGVKWEDAAKAMEGEVAMFAQWCEGDVWGVIVYEADEPEDEDEEPDWTEVDSCWGFYGTDEDNGMREHVPQEHWGLLDKALECPGHG